MENYDRDYAQEVGRRLAAMTPAEMGAYAAHVATQAAESYKQKLASTTSEQAIGMLRAIIQDSVDPENWTAKQQDDYSTINFVADWLEAQQSK